MNVVDLFCGVGGMSLGLEMAGFTTILGVEKDKNIAKGFLQNHPNAPCLIGDISTLKNDAYKNILKDRSVDVIVGGPPCQGFSQKGKRLSLGDERNYLFRYFVNIVKEYSPVAFIIENVPNILSTASGYFFEEIKSSFDDLGYTVSAKVMLASNYGVPQSRRRAFIVGIRGGKQFSFPNHIEQKITVHDALSDLPVLKAGEGTDFSPYPTKAKNDYQTLLRAESLGIYNHNATNHSKLALTRLAMIPENGGKENLPKEHITKSIFSGTWKRLRSHEQAPTITTRFDTPSSGQFTLPTQNRCLTVREAARLQSFPDSFIFTGTKSNQMLQVGNAVPPLLAFELGKSLLSSLMEGSNNVANLVTA